MATSHDIAARRLPRCPQTHMGLRSEAYRPLPNTDEHIRMTHFTDSLTPCLKPAT
jgi:hypothetical protein